MFYTACYQLAFFVFCHFSINLLHRCCLPCVGFASSLTKLWSVRWFVGLWQCACKKRWLIFSSFLSFIVYGSAAIDKLLSSSIIGYTFIIVLSKSSQSCVRLSLVSRLKKSPKSLLMIMYLR